MIVYGCVCACVCGEPRIGEKVCEKVSSQQTETQADP